MGELALGCNRFGLQTFHDTIINGEGMKEIDQRYTRAVTTGGKMEVCGFDREGCLNG